MRTHDLDALNLDTVRETHGRSHLIFEDDPPMSLEDDDASRSVEDNESMPSAKRTFRASTIFLFVFLVLAGLGGAFAWQSYGDQMIGSWARPAATTKPTDSPEVSLQELQQQLNSIATDLAAVKQTLEQQSADNHDQLARVQEQIAQQSIALQATKQELSEKLSSPPSTDKHVLAPPRKPAQHVAHSSQESSKPMQVAPPQSLLPPKQ